jgi:hypothetical protein
VKLPVLLTFLLGFSTSAALGADPPAPPPRADETELRPKPVNPTPLKTLDEAVNRGVAFLLKDQNKDGSWGTAQRTKELNIYTPVPDGHMAYRCAVTALCIMALIEIGGDSPAVLKSLERGEKWLLENLPELRRSSADVLYNIWGHAYGIQALVRMHLRLPGDHARQRAIEKLIRDQMGFLARYESVDGGWGYYDFRVGSQRPATDSTSFITATALIALYEAKELGVVPPDKLVVFQSSIDT